MAKEKKRTSFWADFKDFAVKGNVMDLAVGVVVGGAFGKISASLVNDIIMPLIGLALGGFNFAEWKYELPNVWGLEEPATLNVGMFVQTLMDFLIIALCVFLFVRLATKLRRDKEQAAEVPAAPAAPPEPSEEVLLLREIRDSLKQK